MGAFTSVPTQMIEEETTNIPDGTPQPAKPRNKRILAIDPRSPSESILRTPIVVEQTPSQAQTPDPQTVSSLLKDPRSPTTDFTRTPLAFGHARSRDLPALAFVPPTTDSPVSHLSLNSESGIESADITPVWSKPASEDNLILSSPDSALNIETAYPPVQEDNLNELVCREEEEFPLTCVSKSVDDTPLLASHLQKIHIAKNCETTPLVPIDNTPHNQMKYRHMAVGKKIDAIVMDSKAVRSPLSCVNNSPRHGRPQKFETRPTPPDRNQPVDKENVCH